MASKPMKPCKKIGCYKLTQEVYCEDHIHLKVDFLKESRKFYDSYKRDDKLTKFYNSKEWKKVRTLRMMKDNHLCVNCLEKNRYTQATSVHHIVKLKDDWDKRLDINNLKSLCERCHKKEDVASRRK